MPDLLLHHYDGSPFSEKVRTALGWKGLAWRSVLQPNMMPKPHLVPLTGGYRRIPVLQIGADVYCDSHLIARVIERVRPEPTLFPGGSEGLCLAMGFWTDRLLFLAAVPVVFAAIGPAVPREFVEDRTKLMGGRGDFSAVMKAGPAAADSLRAHAAFLETQLCDGHDYLLGAAPSLADFSAYHPVWFLRSIPPVAKTLESFVRVSAWADRIAAIGHGRREECSPEEALRVARESQPAALDSGVDPREPQGFVPGERVRVVPDDYGFEPVEGALLRADVHEIAVLRESREVGEVAVHFPRAGFRVERA
jgi:glutathione S-transferase